ncbi:MAG: hypothetical protein V1725_00245 [archaeon]
MNPARDFLVRLAKTQHKLQLRPVPVLSDQDKHNITRAEKQSLLADIIFAEKLLQGMRGKYPDAILNRIGSKIAQLRRMAA